MTSLWHFAEVGILIVCPVRLLRGGTSLNWFVNSADRPNSISFLKINPDYH